VAEEHSRIPIHTYDGIIVITRVPVVVVLDRIAHMVGTVANPDRYVGIIQPTECFGVYGFKAFNAPVVQEEEVRKLAILVVGDLGIVHEERNDRDLLVVVDLGGCRIFIGLPHMKCSCRYGDHAVWYGHDPSFSPGDAHQFTLVTASAAQAEQSAGAGHNAGEE